MISRWIRSLLTITPLLLPFAANAQEDANVARHGGLADETGHGSRL